MRKWQRMSAGLVAAAMLSGGAAIAQDARPECNAPERVEGRVVKVDRKQGKVVLRAANGADHEFNASPETLQDFKVGDQIEAKLRSAPNCK